MPILSADIFQWDIKMSSFVASMHVYFVAINFHQFLVNFLTLLAII